MDARRLFLVTSIALATAQSGCGSNANSSNNPDAGPDTRCQPIAPNSNNCFLPFPSSYYLTADSTTETGYRVSVPVGILPKNQVGVDFDVTRLNQFDGWSPSTQLVADLGARVDPSQLPKQGEDLGGSITAQSAVQLIDYATGERVPLFAEVDNNATDPSQTQVLLIHPMIRLKNATRYVVALVGLKDTSGQTISIQPFQALVSGNVDTGSPLARVQSRYQEIFASLEKQGVPRTTLTLAWDFVTSSDKQVTGNLLAMRDAALKRWEAQNLGWQVMAMDVSKTDSDLMMQIDGTFDSPSFLSSLTKLDAGLKLDAQGRAVDSGENFPARLHINVPKCAMSATKPLPILIFGHGLFGSATEIDSGWQKAMINQTLCMVEVATDWTGFDAVDSVVEVAEIFGSFDKFSILSDRSQQGMVNFLVLARMAARKLKDMPELQINGKPIVDGSELYYYGISQGGCIGATLVSLSPELQRGGLDVGGNPYSLMLMRSSDFESFKEIMDMTYPAPATQELLIALSQSFFDFFEESGFIGHGLHDPFPDPDTGMPMPIKQIVLQESKNDAQVPNVGTRTLARTAQLPQLNPPNEVVYGLEQKDGPLPSAYTQWDPHATPAPGSVDTPPANNCAHEAIRRLPELQAQLKAFFTPTGMVTQTCNGKCDFPIAPGCGM